MVHKVAAGILGLVLVLALPACNNDSPQSPESIAEDSVESSPLAKVLTATISQSNREQDDYIIYDASSNSFTSMNADDYALAQAFADLVVRSNDSTVGGHGWIEVGKGTNDLSTDKISATLNHDIKNDDSFVVKVVYGPDGSYTVYYRIIPKG